MRLDEINKQIKSGSIQGLPYKRSKDITKYITWIKKNCSDFLTQSHGSPLYRGVHRNQLQHLVVNKSDIFLGNSEKNRLPKNSDAAAQLAIDAHLKAAGFKALRSNSIFCTGNSRETAGYGNMYYIFPLNGFTFTWNDKITDLYIDWPIGPEEVAEYQKDKESYSANLSLYGKNKKEKLDNIFSKPNKEFAIKYGFKKDDLYSAITSFREIYIHGKYLAIDADLMSRQLYFEYFGGV